MPVADLTADAPARTLVLFVRYQQGSISATELDEYSKILMALVNQRLTEDLIQSIRHARLDPHDVAQDAVLHLLHKSRAMNLRAPCPLVLMKMLHTSFHRFLCTAFTTAKRKGAGREINWTEMSTDESWAGRSIALSIPAPPASVVTRRDIAAALDVSTESMTADVCEGGAGRRLFTHLCDRLFDGRGFPTFAQLPEQLQKEGTYELHAILTSRITRFVCEHAEG
jgi:hypothetical protein